MDLKPSAANSSLWRKGRYLKRRQQKVLRIHRDSPLQRVEFQGRSFLLQNDMFPLLSFLNQFYCEMLHAYRKGHKIDDTQLNDLSESKHSLTHHLGQEMERLRSLGTTPNLESSPSALPSPPELTTSLTLISITSLLFCVTLLSVPKHYFGVPT